MLNRAGDLNHLELSPEQMRELGYSAIDAIVDHLTNIREKPPGTVGTRADLERLLREPMPLEGGDPARVIRRLQEQVFGHQCNLPHPRFFAFVPSPGNYISVLADLLASGYNTFVGSWLSGSGPAMLELVTVDWLTQVCGLPSSAGGLFVSGGSMANLTGLAAARHGRQASVTSDVLYCSDQTHSSIPRALRVLGVPASGLRILSSDGDYRIPTAELRRQIQADREAGLRPFCVVANAGTTNTGAVDPLAEIAVICREEGLWMHVDGAYGAAAMMSPRGRELLRGIENADSVALDPHKWLFQPFDCGCVLVKDRATLRDAFHTSPEYLRDVSRTEEEVNLFDYGVELTRPFRALKLWLSLQVFGAHAFAQAIERGFQLAEEAERLLRERAGWQIVTAAQLAILTFRYAPPGLTSDARDEINRTIGRRVTSEGHAVVTSTLLRGQTVLRFCTINPRTTARDLEDTIDAMHRIAQEEQHAI